MLRKCNMLAAWLILIASPLLAKDEILTADVEQEVNVAHVDQSAKEPQPPAFHPQSKSFTVDTKYLVIPINNGAKQSRLELSIDGQPVRRYDTQLAVDPEEVDWYAFFTIESYQGQTAKVTVDRGTQSAFDLIRQADQIPGSETFYTEALRPQFRFSQKVGWNNDPNGMVYLAGQWHLFFQHNPVGWNWGNMTWGHAVSEDLIHWQQLPNVLFPKTMAQGDCFSGGGTIDVNNTAGWKTGDNDVLVVFLTDTGSGESVAYSNDRGRTFTWYARNPVVKHRGRDPKVIWYSYDNNEEPLNERARELGGHWAMAVYDEDEQYGKNIAFYTSADLKQWQEQSHLPGYFECPELFELPIDGDPDRTRWVTFAADASYAIGDFDGQTFTPDGKEKHQLHWGKYYASQTFENAPGRRRIQIGWVRIDTPGMPFNQTFSFPHELSLRTTEEGIRLFAQPVKEIAKLHLQRHALESRELIPEAAVPLVVTGELLDIRATFELLDAKQIGLRFGQNHVTYDAVKGLLGEAKLQPIDGRISLQLLVDRHMLEICGNDGRVFITAEREHRGNVQSVEAFAMGGRARLISLEVFELASIWDSGP